MNTFYDNLTTVNNSYYLDSHLIDAFHHFSIGYADCLAGEFEKVKASIIRSPSLLSNIDGDGQTLFYIFAASNQLDCLQWLYQQDPSVLKVCRADGRNPMHAAVEQGHLRIVEWLHAQDPSLIDQSDHAMLTPLHIAAFNEEIMILKLFKDQLKTNMSLIHQVAQKNCSKTLAFIFELDVDLDTTNYQKQTLGNNNVGLIYKSLRDYERALEYFQKGFTICNMDKSLPHFEIILKNIIDSATNISPSPIKTLKEIYPTSMNILGPKHELNIKIKFQIINETPPSVAQCFNNLVIKCGSLEALNNLKEALEIYSIFLGENHPSTARCYINISTIYNELKDYDQALWYRQKAFIIQNEVLGTSHPCTVESYEIILYFCSVINKNQKSLEFHQLAVKISLNNCRDEEHPYIARSYSFIIATFENLEEDKKSLDFLKTAARSYKSLGSILERRKMYQGALENFQKAFITLKEIDLYNDGDPMFIDLQKHIDLCQNNLKFKELLNPSNVHPSRKVNITSHS